MFIGSSKNSKRGLNLKKLGYYGRIVVKWLRMLGIWWEGGEGGARFSFNKGED